MDTLGLAMAVLVTAANLPEQEGSKWVLQRLSELSAKVCRLYLVRVDVGCISQSFGQWVMDRFR